MTEPTAKTEVPPDVIFLVASCMNNEAFHVETVGDREELVIYTGLRVNEKHKLDWMKDE